VKDIYDVPSDPLPPKERALHNLHIAIWTQAHRLVVDARPSVTDKILIVHEMTAPEHRVDPGGMLRGAECLERLIAANSSNLAYEIFLGPVVSALLKYGNAIGRKREAVGVAD